MNGIKQFSPVPMGDAWISEQGRNVAYALRLAFARVTARCETETMLRRAFSSVSSTPTRGMHTRS